MGQPLRAGDHAVLENLGGSDALVDLALIMPGDDLHARLLRLPIAEA